MDQELEAGANFSPRLVTAKTWATVLNSIYPLPTPVTPDFVQYMFNVCMIYSLPTSVPYAVAHLLHHLHHVPLLEGWTGQGVFLVAIVIMAKSLCKSPPPPSNFWWSHDLFEVEAVTICNMYRSLPDLFPMAPDQMCRSWKHSEGSKQK